MRAVPQQDKERHECETPSLREIRNKQADFGAGYPDLQHPADDWAGDDWQADTESETQSTPPQATHGDRRPHYDGLPCDAACTSINHEAASK